MNKNDKTESLLNFILGVSWVVLGIGTLLTFIISIKIFSFGIALTLAFLFLVLSGSLVLFLESYKLNIERLKEAKKQTEIFEKIEAKLTQKEILINTKS